MGNSRLTGPSESKQVYNWLIKELKHESRHRILTQNVVEEITVILVRAEAVLKSGNHASVNVTIIELTIKSQDNFVYNKLSMMCCFMIHILYTLPLLTSGAINSASGHGCLE